MTGPDLSELATIWKAPQPVMEKHLSWLGLGWNISCSMDLFIRQHDRLWNHDVMAFIRLAWHDGLYEI